MLLGDTIHRTLRLSRLSPTTGYSVFKQIVHASRQRNRKLGITGALIFDGERFCQLLEGESDTVHALIRTIDADQRHTAQAILYAGSGPRLLTTWQSGYCDHEALDQLHRAAAPGGDAALNTFVNLLDRCDLSD